MAAILSCMVVERGGAVASLLLGWAQCGSAVASLLLAWTTATALAAVLGASAVVLLALALAVIRCGSRWGATPDECAAELSGDRFLADGQGSRGKMTRAISIAAPPDSVWPWLAQLGRGAGFYSYDWLDNGGRRSARHIVTWIPEPRLGDAVVFGYLRHLEPGRTLVWWLERFRWFGAWWRACFQYHLLPEPNGARLIARVLVEGTGLTAPLALALFQLIDSIMMRRQLLGLKQRVERFGRRGQDPDAAETGRRDQYQGPMAIYANGQRAGLTAEAEVARWRQLAIDAGLIPPRPLEHQADGQGG